MEIIPGDGERSPRSGRGGLAFDVVLEPAQRDAPAGAKMSPRIEKQSTQEDIERKLREAEERREKLERDRLERLKLENEEKIGKIKEKLSAVEQEYAQKQKAELEQSLGESAERREAILREKQEKVKAHEEHAKEVRNRKSLLADDPSIIANGSNCSEHAAEVQAQ